MLRLLPATLTVFMLGITASGAEEVLPGVMGALENADSYELISLDPDRRTAKEPGEKFHGWRVLGSTKIADPEVRKQVTEALRKAASEPDGTVVGCFDPRHGIRVVRGNKTMELVICFECITAHVHAENAKPTGFRVTNAAQPVFDEVLKKAGVAMPPPARKG